MSSRPRSDVPVGAGRDATEPDGESEAGRAGPDFESSLEKLESIVDRLEGGDLPLEAALAAFEEGVSLIRRCAEELEAAERRIEVLVREGEHWATRPFEEPGETE